MGVTIIITLTVIMIKVVNCYEITENDPRHDLCRQIHGIESQATSCPSSVYQGYNLRGDFKGNCGGARQRTGATEPKRCKAFIDTVCGALHCHLPFVQSTLGPHFSKLVNTYSNTTVYFERSDESMNCYVVTSPTYLSRWRLGTAVRDMPCGPGLKCSGFNDCIIDHSATSTTRSTTVRTLPPTTRSTTATTTTRRTTTTTRAPTTTTTTTRRPTTRSTTTLPPTTTTTSTTMSPFTLPSSTQLPVTTTMVPVVSTEAAKEGKKKSKMLFKNKFFLALLATVIILALLVVIATCYYIYLVKSNPIIIQGSRNGRKLGYKRIIRR